MDARLALGRASESQIALDLHEGGEAVAGASGDAGNGSSARGAEWLTVDCRDGELFQVRAGQSSGFPVLWGVRHAAGGCAPTGR